MAGKILHISLSRWREREGVRVDKASDCSPSLPLCGIPTSIFLKRSGTVSSPPVGERKRVWAAEDKSDRRSENPKIDKTIHWITM
jgi:hypothetical protein